MCPSHGNHNFPRVCLAISTIVSALVSLYFHLALLPRLLLPLDVGHSFNTTVAFPVSYDSDNDGNNDD